MTRRTAESDNCITKSRVKELGFTDKMIVDLLGEPDLEKTNPIFKCASPMKLWREDRVRKAMDSDEFRRARAAADKRSQAAKKSAQTRRENTMRIVEEAIDSLDVERPDYLATDEDVMEAAVEHKRLLDLLRNKTSFYDYSSADDKTKLRWAVNYIRHSHTNYDSVLDGLKGKTGVDEAYTAFKRGVHEAIAKEYPFLASECWRQLSEPWWLW